MGFTHARLKYPYRESPYPSCPITVKNLSIQLMAPIVMSLYKTIHNFLLSDFHYNSTYMYITMFVATCMYQLVQMHNWNWYTSSGKSGKEQEPHYSLTQQTWLPGQRWPTLVSWHQWWPLHGRAPDQAKEGEMIYTQLMNYIAQMIILWKERELPFHWADNVDNVKQANFKSSRLNMAVC